MRPAASVVTTPRLLCLSNGHGEDLIAAEVVRHLPDREVVAFPLVGLGAAYPPSIPRLDPRRVFPSGGFAFRAGHYALWADLRSGIIRFWLAQRRTLAAQRDRFSLVLAVGDVYCLTMARLMRAPAMLVETADSVLSAPFNGGGLRVLRQAVRVFTRDRATADWLRPRRVNAEFVGNPMMDCLRPAGADFGLGPDQPVVALLPGSRDEALRNAVLLAQVAAGVAAVRPGVGFLLSAAPTVDDGALQQALRTGGASLPDGAPGWGEVGARLIVTRDFADAITRADVVVGMAGTANEQAAGLGKPVVVFPGAGPQFTREFIQLQRRILGDALVETATVADAAATTLRLLASPEERARHGRVGRERMGEAGGAPRIAAELAARLAQVSGPAQGRPTPR